MRWTEQQLRDYDVRRAAKQTGPPSGCDDESELHQQILDECKRRNWIALHSRMDKRSTATIGSPDFVILRDLGDLLLVECKTRTGKLSIEQLALHVWAERLGHKVHTVRSFEEFCAILLYQKL